MGLLYKPVVLQHGPALQACDVAAWACSNPVVALAVLDMDSLHLFLNQVIDI